MTVSVPAIAVAEGEVIVEKDSYGTRYTFGHLEAWICLGCGYTEHYTVGLPSAHQLAETFTHQVTLIE